MAQAVPRGWDYVKRKVLGGGSDAKTEVEEGAWRSSDPYKCLQVRHQRKKNVSIFLSESCLTQCLRLRAAGGPGSFVVDHQEAVPETVLGIPPRKSQHPDASEAFIAITQAYEKVKNGGR